MPHRLTFFFIALIGLLTNLISVSITIQDAYASKISAQETIDFWLDLPLGKSAKFEYIADDFEVTDWLLTDLDEIDVKSVSPSYNIYISEIDPFDPFQIVVKIFLSNLLIFPSISILMLFFTCAGLVVLDKFTFQTVLHNCFRSDKSISWRRMKKEIRRFSQFALTILIIIVFYIVFSTTLLALFPQEFLWNNQYRMIALLLYFGLTFYFSVFKLSRVIFKGYKTRVIRRSDFYYFNDLDRLNKKTA